MILPQASEPETMPVEPAVPPVTEELPKEPSEPPAPEELPVGTPAPEEIPPEPEAPVFPEELPPASDPEAWDEPDISRFQVWRQPVRN